MVSLVYPIGTVNRDIIMCNCFNEMLEKVEVMAKEQLANTPMVEGSFKIDWRDRVFFPNGKQGAPIAIYLDSSYIPLKKNGEPMKSKKKLQNGFKMSHCPFCGVEYE